MFTGTGNPSDQNGVCDGAAKYHTVWLDKFIKISCGSCGQVKVAINPPMSTDLIQLQ